MKRYLLNATAGLSLLACLAAGVFWIRSVRFKQSEVGESLNFRSVDPRWWVVSCRGTLTLCRQNGRDWGKEFGSVEGLGFHFGGLKGPHGSLWNLAVPYWFLVSATLLPPAAHLARLRRLRRLHRPGLCERCGYDLRATPGRCPECGALASP